MCDHNTQCINYKKASNKQNKTKTIIWEKNQLLANATYLPAKSGNKRSKETIKVYSVTEYLFQQLAVKMPLWNLQGHCTINSEAKEKWQNKKNRKDCQEFTKYFNSIRNKWGHQRNIPFQVTSLVPVSTLCYHVHK